MRIRPLTFLATALAALAAVPAAAAPRPSAASFQACPGRDRAREEGNKALVRHLCRHLFGPAPVEALGGAFAQDLIQHDPAIPDGRAAMLDWIRAQRALAPSQSLVPKHLLADGDLVLVHAQVTATPDDEATGTDRFDLYRLDGGCIVEHWEVRQRVPSHTASGNSLFSDLYAYASHPTRVSEGQEEANRHLVMALSNAVFSQRRFDLLDPFWAAGYLQHNPYVGNGRAALASVLDYIAPEGSHYRIVKSLADGDLVWVMSQNVDPGDDAANEFTGAAVCDLYRVVDFQMVEHWDSAQGVPPTSVNGHSMFSDLYRR